MRNDRPSTSARDAKKFIRVARKIYKRDLSRSLVVKRDLAKYSSPNGTKWVAGSGEIKAETILTPKNARVATRERAG